MVEIQEYLKLRERPAGPPAMYQKWRDLTFLHFAIDPQEIQKLLPEGLDIDTYPDDSGDEKAWIGLVPFWMTGIRLRGLPPVPGLTMFPETNVRTYVHRKGKQPGVWFFSLEAANKTACAWARTFFGLPYHWAAMEVSKVDRKITYSSFRHQDTKALCSIAVNLGEEQPGPTPGTLDFFLLERYLLYSVKKGAMFTGVVNHKPYPVKQVARESVEEQLTAAAQIPRRPWSHTIYSPGVDVEVFSVQPVSS